MFALVHRHAWAIADEAFDQHHYLPLCGRPLAGLGEGQWHMVASAAFATAGAGKTNGWIHLALGFHSLT